MVKRLARWGIWLAVFLACSAGAAKADPITGLTLAFTGGGTLSGNFQIDPGTNTLVNWNLTASGLSTFANHTYVNTDPSAGEIILSNSDGDEVLSFVQTFADGLDELDIVVACGGTANCLNQATTSTPMSFALGTTPPCGGAITICIASGEQRVVGVGSAFLAPGFLQVSDPPGTISLNVASASVGTVFNGTPIGGGGGPTNTPEPETWLLLACGLGGLLVATMRKKWNARPVEQVG